MIIDENTAVTGITRRKYVTIDANSIETDEYTIPNGAVLQIQRCGGDAAFDNEVKVEIKFDNDIFFSTHTSIEHNAEIECIGDGIKKVVIKLVNDSSATETIGGFWSGYIVE